MKLLHQNPKGRRPACRALLCLLVLSLWRAPIPWLDTHETLDADDHHALDQTSSDPVVGLDEHLAEFHLDVNQSSIRQLGWHVHFVLPWKGLGRHQHRSPQQPHGPEGPLSTLNVTGATPVLVQVSNLPAAWCAANSRHLAARESVPLRGACRFPVGSQVRGFLGTYGSTGALRALLGVALC